MESMSWPWNCRWAVVGCSPQSFRDIPASPSGNLETPVNRRVLALDFNHKLETDAAEAFVVLSWSQASFPCVPVFDHLSYP